MGKKASDKDAAAGEPIESPPVPPSKENKRRIEFQPPPDFDLCQFHDDLVAEGVKPLQVEQFADGAVRLSFEDEEAREAAKDVVQAIKASYRKRERPVAKTKAELMAAIQDARVGTNEFKLAVLEALNELL